LDGLDTSFAELVEQLRRERARMLLDDPRMGLKEVASRLGFSDDRAFVRAYKRWTGSTPRGRRGS